MPKKTHEIKSESELAKPSFSSIQFNEPDQIFNALDIYKRGTTMKPLDFKITRFIDANNRFSPEDLT
jgi:hypothetical protein